MRLLKIGKNEENQRLDKYLQKYLSLAGKSFIYKMLRKKNITLNDRKCSGDEKIKAGDEIRLWMRESTIDNFIEKANVSDSFGFKIENAEYFKSMIIYEDEDIAVIDKPKGLLSQKSKPDDICVNDLFIEYLFYKNEVSKESLRTFKPSICNRLDRNTGGIMICGKSLRGLQNVNEFIKNRTIKKEYLCPVFGSIVENTRIRKQAWLKKDEKLNKVMLSDTKKDGWDYIETEYTCIKSNENISLLLVHLITGRSHQIRAHMAFLGYPVLGDEKYGNRKFNQKLKKYNINSQMLHSYRLEMPYTEILKKISKRVFETKIPKSWERILWEHGNQEA